MDSQLKGKIAIVGLGYTPMVRKTEKSLGRIAIDAALDATGPPPRK